ncbi:hypothetical protein DPMN_029315 [Dreissena polymorpha]|uniref:Uncharacterized protein n=1 Tax=Dreissena polymorpha TaxID=45954 RepID=A0A9D4LVW4_DREPO|nr:hypothetical protein DPMN_029113 [Dreissena polymorpha]KAH3866256.1 hypothetical protein DPMN_029315 [Dreissena polymorpha]
MARPTRILVPQLLTHWDPRVTGAYLGIQQYARALCLRPDSADTLERSIVFGSKQLYHSIMLYLVMPVSTATAEISFSTMRRVVRW